MSCAKCSWQHNDSKDLEMNLASKYNDNTCTCIEIRFKKTLLMSSVSGDIRAEVASAKIFAFQCSWL